MKIKGFIKLIKDKNNFNYCAVEVNSIYYKKYEEFMINNGLENEVNMKLKRDNNCYHITIFNVMEWGVLVKNGLDKEIINNFKEELIFDTFGIGSVEKKNNKTYFVVLKNQQLQELRKKYLFKTKDYHITLGFKEKDIFGIDKDEKKIIFSNQEIFSASNTIKKKI